MTLYHATADGYTGFDPLDLRAKCSVCGQMFPLDIVDHVLNGGSLGGEPKDWPWCPDCAGKRGNDRSKEDDNNV